MVPGDRPGSCMGRLKIFLHLLIGGSKEQSPVSKIKAAAVRINFSVFMLSNSETNDYHYQECVAASKISISEIFHADV